MDIHTSQFDVIQLRSNRSKWCRWKLTLWNQGFLFWELLLLCPCISSSPPLVTHEVRKRGEVSVIKCTLSSENCNTKYSANCISLCADMKKEPIMSCAFLLSVIFPTLIITFLYLPDFGVKCLYIFGFTSSVSGLGLHLLECWSHAFDVIILLWLMPQDMIVSL